ncbi:uncharacterized protein LOC126792520 [Argentina anserina]|uniref:uncharacterized protein LOC126792520 n=1 Tax=Argentina anserina TaxID=57926 RepID=UPI00217620D6|nr:uncharacterized protein LOC126792520 [Potentilla anserina]
MGGVASKSEKPSRVDLAGRAMELQNGFAKAQKDYNDSQNEMATAFKEFVHRHCSSEQHAVNDDPEREDEHIVTEEPEPRIQSSGTAKVAQRNGTKRNNNSGGNRKQKDNQRNGTEIKDAGMVAEKPEASTGFQRARNEDNQVAPEDVVVQAFKEVGESGSGIYKLLEKSGQVEIGREHKKKLVRSFTRTRSTTSRSKGLARSRSSKVSDHCGEKAEATKEDYSTLYKLYVKEQSLLRDLLTYDEIKFKFGEGFETQEAKDRAQEAFDRISKLRDEELQPLLSNLFKSLHENWKIMSECHDEQRDIMSKKSLFEPHDACCDNDHWRDTNNLLEKLHEWRNALTCYIGSQKSYVESLKKWSECGGHSVLKIEENDNGCTKLLRHWFKCFEDLHKELKEATKAMADFEKEMQKLWDQENEELICKSKVDKLNEDIRKQLVNKNKEPKQEKRDEELNESKKKNKKRRQEKKDQELNELRKKLEDQKKAYGTSQMKRKEIVKQVIQESFALLFKSLKEFTSKAAEAYVPTMEHDIEVIN